jgi:hypothetical protein
VRRFFLLLLLAVLPLQMTWAAGVTYCPHDGSHANHASVPDGAAHAVDGHEHGNDGGDDGHSAGSGLDCSVFQFVALEPPAARAQPLPRACATAHDVVRSDYESHIPTGLERPNWRFAA